MKKRYMKLTALLLIISLLASSNAFAFDNSNTYAINTDIDITSSERAKEYEANTAYSNLLSSFRTIYEETNAEASRSSSANSLGVVRTEYTVDGIPADGFPAYYAGAYINANHELVVMLTENTFSVRSQAETLSKSADTNYRVAVHSYSELVYCMDEVTNKFLEEGFKSLKYALIDDYNNRVVVGTQRIDSEYMEFLQQELEYYDVIEFVECGDMSNAVQLTSGDCVDVSTTLYTYPEATMPNDIDNLERCSFGFKATKVINGVTKKGFVTAGHAISEGEYIHIGGIPQYTQIGRCIESIYTNGRRCDAAFVEATNGYYEQLSGSFTTQSGASRTTSTQTRTLAQGSEVRMFGGVTQNECVGTVVSASFYFNLGAAEFYSDVVLANYLSQPGDSGGLVYSLSAPTAYPAGIHTFLVLASQLTGWGFTFSYPPHSGSSYYSGYCKMYNVLDELDVAIAS